MPLYEYRCQSCAQRFEVLKLSVKDKESETKCPSCGATEVERLLSSFAAVNAGGGTSAAKGCSPGGGGFS